MSTDASRAELIARRNAAMAEISRGWEGHDDLDPTGPSGHEYGISQSTRLTSDYRQQHRKDAMDITPRQVMDCLIDARVKDWVLMGLHGYVGYLPMPRATQDVDVMVSARESEKAVEAIQARWPTLEIARFPVVIRFGDPGDLDAHGKAKQVIDLMLPNSQFQKTILSKHVKIDDQTGDRYPTVEAAIVSKYSAMISPHRGIDKTEQDAVDLRRLLKANHERVQLDLLQSLAEEIWLGGGADILDYLNRAIEDKTFDV